MTVVQVHVNILTKFIQHATLTQMELKQEVTKKKTDKHAYLDEH